MARYSFVIREDDALKNSYGTKRCRLATVLRLMPERARIRTSWWRLPEPQLSRSKLLDRNAGRGRLPRRFLGWPRIQTTFVHYRSNAAAIDCKIEIPLQNRCFPLFSLQNRIQRFRRKRFEGFVKVACKQLKKYKRNLTQILLLRCARGCAAAPT